MDVFPQNTNEMFEHLYFGKCPEIRGSLSGLFTDVQIGVSAGCIYVCLLMRRANFTKLVATKRRSQNFHCSGSNYHNIGDGDIIRTDWRINLGGGSRWRKKQTPKFTNCRAPWKLLGWKSLRWLLLVF